MDLDRRIRKLIYVPQLSGAPNNKTTTGFRISDTLWAVL